MSLKRTNASFKAPNKARAVEKPRAIAARLPVWTQPLDALSPNRLQQTVARPTVHRARWLPEGFASQLFFVILTWRVSVLHPHKRDETRRGTATKPERVPIDARPGQVGSLGQRQQRI